MLIAVNQVMDPDSSIMRRLSSRTGSRHASSDRKGSHRSESGSGADNKAYEAGSEVFALLFVLPLGITFEFCPVCTSSAKILPKRRLVTYYILCSLKFISSQSFVALRYNWRM